MTAPHLIKEPFFLMGNQFEISVVSSEKKWALDCIQAAVVEIMRIEKLLTTYNEESETCKINLHAGIEPVKVSNETFQLIERAQRISAITQGSFDLSYGSVDKKLWNFDTTMTCLPDPKAAKDRVRLINYHNIELNSIERTVFLKEKGMRIGFGGIGKGYAADRAKQVLMRMGVEHGVVNASGDLNAWGMQPDGSPWTIGIADPNLSGEIFSLMKITGLAVATSGNYEKYITINGKKYSHTIDPRSGMPVHGIKSVTIITQHAELADAMATPVTIMGVDAGLHMINQIKDIEAIIIDDQNKIHCSKNIHIN